LRKAGQAGSPTEDDKSDFKEDGIRFLEMLGAEGYCSIIGPSVYIDFLIPVTWTTVHPKF
jgi:hypothetical protein